MMLNDDMMNTGGTGSRDIEVSGQKHIHKGTSLVMQNALQLPSCYHKTDDAVFIQSSLKVLYTNGKIEKLTHVLMTTIFINWCPVTTCK